MVSAVRLSSRAQSDFANIVDYLKDNWSISEIRRFNRIFRKRIQAIKLFPYSYPSISNRHNLRKCVLIHQITLYYKVNEDEIIIISLHDSRSDPSKLKL